MADNENKGIMQKLAETVKTSGSKSGFKAMLAGGLLTVLTACGGGGGGGGTPGGGGGTPPTEVPGHTQGDSHPYEITVNNGAIDLIAHDGTVVFDRANNTTGASATIDAATGNITLNLNNGNPAIIIEPSDQEITVGGGGNNLPAKYSAPIDLPEGQSYPTQPIPASYTLNDDGANVGGSEVNILKLPAGDVLITNGSSLTLTPDSFSSIQGDFSDPTHLTILPDPDGAKIQSLDSSIYSISSGPGSLTLGHVEGSDGKPRVLASGASNISVSNGGVVIGFIGDPDKTPGDPPTSASFSSNTVAGFNVAVKDDNGEITSYETVTKLETGEKGTVNVDTLVIVPNPTTNVTNFSAYELEGGVRNNGQTSRVVAGADTGDVNIQIGKIENTVTFFTRGNVTTDIGKGIENVSFVDLKTAQKVVDKAAPGLSGAKAAAFIKGNPDGTVVEGGKTYSSEDVKEFSEVLKILNEANKSAALESNPVRSNNVVPINPQAEVSGATAGEKVTQAKGGVTK